jgi:hypothetical protein
VTVQTLVPDSQTAVLGGVWVLTVLVEDDDGANPTAAPVCTVTLPAGTTSAPAMVDQGLGVWRTLYTTTVVGRHVARIVSTGYGAADLTLWVTGLTVGTGMPVVADITAYLGTSSWSTPEIQDALDAEAAAQRRVCEIPADYPDDLEQALKRRVARNLAMRRTPTAVLRGDGEAGDATILPGRDPEIARLERPYRRVNVG